MEQTPPKVREIAWRGQSRLTARCRLLSGRGKKTMVVCTAIASELAGFMWATAKGGASGQIVDRGDDRLAPRASAEAGLWQGNIS